MRDETKTRDADSERLAEIFTRLFAASRTWPAHVLIAFANFQGYGVKEAVRALECLADRGLVRQYTLCTYAVPDGVKLPSSPEAKVAQLERQVEEMRQLYHSALARAEAAENKVKEARNALSAVFGLSFRVTS